MMTSIDKDKPGWAERMIDACSSKGLTQVDLSRKTGIALPKMKSYFQGKVRNPRGNELEIISRALGVDEYWLRHGIEPPKAERPPEAPLPARDQMIKDVPVLGTGVGGNDGALNIDGAVDYLRRPPALTGVRDLYAVFVSGDSMEPRYMSGEPVFVNPHRPLSIGDHAVIQCLSDDGSLLAYVKLISGRRNGVWTFAQYNPRGPWNPPGPVHSIDRIVPPVEYFSL